LSVDGLVKRSPARAVLHPNVSPMLEQQLNYVVPPVPCRVMKWCIVPSRPGRNIRSSRDQEFDDSPLTGTGGPVQRRPLLWILGVNEFPVLVQQEGKSIFQAQTCHRENVELGAPGK